MPIATMAWLNSSASALAVLALDHRLHAGLARFELLDRGADMDLHALLGQRLVHEGRDVLVLDREDPVEHLDDRHLGAHVRIEAGELDADRARADDEQFGRHLLGHHRMAVGPDACPVRLGEGQVAGAGAGRDDDVLRGELGLRPLPGDGQLALGREGAVAFDHRHLVLLHQALDAGIQLPGDLAAAVDDFGEVEADLLRAQAVGRSVGQIVVDLGGAQQRLGRDAAPVQTDAAKLLPLDDRDLETELARPDRRDIAAGPGAEDDQVVGVRHRCSRSE